VKTKRVNFFLKHSVYNARNDVLRAELVSQSDSELEVQRYIMKKNTLTVDPIMLVDEL